MKVALQAVMAAVTLALLTARSDAAPLPSFRFREVSKYTPHVARGLPTQLLPPGFSYTGWVRSAMLNNGHGCAHGPTGCASGSKPGSNPPRPLDTATTKRAGITAPARHPPIEDCGQSPTGCNSKGDPPAPTHHTRAETGEGMPFLGGGCSHSPTGCSVALPTDLDVGTGGGTHGKKRDATQPQDQAPVLAARGKGKGGCAHSPTGCAPGGGGNHPPHPVQGKEETNTVEEDEVQQRALAATEGTLAARGKGRGGCAHSPTGCAPGSGGHIPPPSQGKVQTNVIDEDQVQERALATRGKGKGGCAHSPTGCGPPGGGGNHPPHPAQGEEQTTVIDDNQEERRDLGATEMDLAPRGKGKGGCAHSPTGCPPGGGGNHPVHPQVQERATLAEATLTPRGKGQGGCAHSPTGCGPPGGGGNHPIHPRVNENLVKEPTATSDATLTARGKGKGGCAHSPTGCPPGGGGNHPIHPKVNEEQVQERTATAEAALAPRGKGQGGCAHSPTGCGPPGGGGGHHPLPPSHPEEEQRDLIKEDEELTTTLVAKPTRGKPGRSCGHSPTGCPRPPSPGNGGPNPGHGKRDIVIAQSLASKLAARSRSRGGCGLSPTGCMAPINGAPHIGEKHRRGIPEASTETAALSARGKAKGGCNHSPTGCPPGGGGPHGQK